jgi:hypothetical protein
MELMAPMMADYGGFLDSLSPDELALVRRYLAACRTHTEAQIKRLRGA